MLHLYYRGVRTKIQHFFSITAKQDLICQNKIKQERKEISYSLPSRTFLPFLPRQERADHQGSLKVQDTSERYLPSQERPSHPVSILETWPKEISSGPSFLARLDPFLDPFPRPPGLRLGVCSRLGKRLFKDWKYTHRGETTELGSGQTHFSQSG